MAEGRRRRWTDGVDAGRNPYREHDACGVGFVAHPRQSSHRVLRLALGGLSRVAHRGATGSDRTGDGAGILTRIPDGMFRREASRLSFPLADDAPFAVGTFFLPRRQDGQLWSMEIVEKALAGEGLPHLGWRPVPVRLDRLGPAAEESRPAIFHAFVGRPRGRRFRRVGAEAVPRGPRRGPERAPQELHGFCVVSLSSPDARLQGPPHGDGAQGVLPGPRGPRLRDERRRLPPALLDEHGPELEPRAAVPPPRAQRRDQHALGKPQRDARARARARLARLGRPAPAAPARPHGRGERLDEPRRGARAPRALRARPAARAHDADPGRAAGPPARRAARVLRLPRRPDRAVGRPRGRRVHGRRRRGRAPRPLGPQADALEDRGRRPRRGRVRGRHRGPRPRARRRERPPRPGRDDRGRHRDAERSCSTRT